MLAGSSSLPGRAVRYSNLSEGATVQRLSPEGWSNRVAAAAPRWEAGLVVAHANNGGAMLKAR
jgi:phage terminase large subunit-like protein